MKKILLVLIAALGMAVQMEKELPEGLRNYFAYDKSDSLFMTVDSTFKIEKSVVHRFKLENDSSHIYINMVYPQKAKKIPVIFYQHWGEGDETEFYEEAVEMSSYGYACVLLKAPWLKWECENTSFMKNGYNLYREGALDWIKTWDYIFKHYPFLDSNRVCFVGHSYGAQIAGMMAGLKPQIKAIVFIAGTASTTQSLIESDDSDIMHWKNQKELGFDEWIKKMQPFDAEHYLPLYSGDILLQYARRDEFKIDSAGAMQIKDLSKSENVNFKYYDCTHALNLPDVKTDRIAWIRKHCK